MWVPHHLGDAAHGNRRRVYGDRGQRRRQVNVGIDLADVVRKAVGQRMVSDVGGVELGLPAGAVPLDEEPPHEDREAEEDGAGNADYQVQVEPLLVL